MLHACTLARKHYDDAEHPTTPARSRRVRPLWGLCLCYRFELNGHPRHGGGALPILTGCIMIPRAFVKLDSQRIRRAFLKRTSVVLGSIRFGYAQTCRSPLRPFTGVSRSAVLKGASVAELTIRSYSPRPSRVVGIGFRPSCIALNSA